jgi:hypothetical protein
MRSAGRLVVDPRIHAGEIARFTSHVLCGPTASDCSIWTSAIGADGYGRKRATLFISQHFPNIAGCGTSMSGERARGRPRGTPCLSNTRDG